MSAGMIYGAWDHSQDTLIEGENLRTDMQVDKQQTDIEIQCQTIQYTDGVLEFEAVNEGNTGHDVDGVSIILDGYIADNQINELYVVGSMDSGVWLPGDTLYVNVSVGEEPDQVVLVVDNGIKDICREW
ncbi:hypothetical protein QEN48_00875 [Methanonatronarchaeum sp. AMET-Sl]|nr:hypothetical protein [Methanonatronarchaeum sp. AMET-Sl]WGI17593.1 hypothetical protein QEN48_00875 [Methanonatronarchaeum sp. AMET-Sl]